MMFFNYVKPSPKFLIISGLLVMSPAVSWAKTIYSDNVANGCTVPVDSDYDPATRACGPGSATVYNTFRGGAKALLGGDTLYVMPGNYKNEDYFGKDVTGDQIANGLGSFAQATKIIGHSGGARPLLNPLSIRGGPTKGWIIFEYLDFDAEFIYTTAFSFEEAHHVKLSNSVVRRGMSTGTLTGKGPDNWIVNNKIHDCGGVTQEGNAEHCIYYNGFRMLLERNEIFNCGSFCVHQWTAGLPNKNDGWVIRYNRIYNATQVRATGGEIVLNGGDNEQVYGNILGPSNAASHAGDGGISLAGGSSGAPLTNAKIFNNTVYGKKSSAIMVGVNSSGAEIKNNILKNNAGVDLSDAGTGTVKGYNLCDDAVSGCLSGTSDFVDAAAGNFELLSTSDAIDAGVALGSPWDMDFAGHSRPAGSGYDIGAYEYLEAPTQEVDTAAPAISIVSPTNGALVSR